MRKAKDTSLGPQNRSTFESLVSFCLMNIVKKVIVFSLLDNVKPKLQITRICASF